MSRQLKTLIKKKNKQYRRQLFNFFYQQKLDSEREFNDMAMGALFSTKVGPFLMAFGGLSYGEHMAKIEAVNYATHELIKRGLL